jgi:putative iron-dependent peroxidase
MNHVVAQLTQSLTAEAQEKLTSLAQPTPFSEGNQHAAYLTVHLAYGADPKQVAAAAANIQKIVEKVSPVSREERINGEGAVGGVAFSPEFWQRLTRDVSGLSQPRNARTYHTRSSTNGGMPATGGEIFVHIKAKTRGLAFEIVNEFLQSLPQGSVAKVEDIYGWVFQDNRDLSGFIDGTMNVTGEEDRADESLIGSEDQGHRGGSFIMTQRWLHNLSALHSRSVKEQENVIGRTKDFSAELDPLPKSSHVHRTSSRLVLDDKGREVKIVRQSMPFGDHSGLHGLFFIAYSNNPAKFDRLLDRMAGLEDGVADATFTFSTCDRGQYWYLPNLAELNTLQGAAKSKK